MGAWRGSQVRRKRQIGEWVGRKKAQKAQKCGGGWFSIWGPGRRLLSGVAVGQKQGGRSGAGAAMRNTNGSGRKGRMRDLHNSSNKSGFNSGRDQRDEKDGRDECGECGECDAWRMTPRERDRRVGMVPCARIGQALRVGTTRGPGAEFAEPRAGASEHGPSFKSLFEKEKRTKRLI